MILIFIGLTILEIGNLFDTDCPQCGYMSTAQLVMGVVGFLLCMIFIIAVPAYIQTGITANYQNNLNALLAQQQQIQPQLQPQVLIQPQPQQPFPKLSWQAPQQSDILPPHYDYVTMGYYQQQPTSSVPLYSAAETATGAVTRASLLQTGGSMRP
jgi:hypothetical protein